MHKTLTHTNTHTCKWTLTNTYTYTHAYKHPPTHTDTIWAPQCATILVHSPNEEKKKAYSWCIWYFSHICRPCLWCHWHKLLGAKRKHPQSCFRHFQTVIFNKQDEKLNEKTAVCLVCVPFLLIGTLMVFSFFFLLQIGSPLTRIQNPRDTPFLPNP